MPRSKEDFEKIRITTRRKILSVSLDFFSQKGYDSTPISEIAKTCGLSKSSLYHHFESKEKILTSILIDAYNDWKSKYGLSEKYDNPVLELRRNVLDTVASVKENPKFYKLIHNLQDQLPDTDNVREMIGKISSDKMATYHVLFEKMGFKDPINEIYFFGATLSGAINAYLIVGEDYPIDGVVERLLKGYENND